LQIQGIPDSWVFCRKEAPGGEESISAESPITSGLEEIFFPVPGVLEKSKNSELSFEPLVQTGETAAGTISFRDFMENERDPALLREKQGEPAKGAQVIAAHIRGVLAEDDTMSDAGAEDADEPAAGDDEPDATDDTDAEADLGDSETEADDDQREINVIYIADIDLMMSAFLRIRARPGEDEEISWNFENVTFLLNAIDFLTGDDAYIGIRKRKPRHSTLRRVEYQAQMALEDELKEQISSQEEYNEAIEKIEEENKKEIEKFEKRVQELQEQQLKEGQQGIRMVDLQKALQDLSIQQERLKRRLDVRKEQLRRKLDSNLERIRRRTDLEILKTKNDFKLLAVVLPPITPLLIGLIVFVRRRLREREGISKARRR
jgi:ABC-2 type transport system permease protein